MLKKKGKSKNITFTVKPKIVTEIENWEGYQITYLDGFRGEIKLKIEKEPENKK